MSVPSPSVLPSGLLPGAEPSIQVDTPSDTDHSSSTHWVIAGTVVGVVLLIGLGVGLFFCIRRRRRSRRAIRPLDPLMSDRHIQDDEYCIYTSSSESSSPTHAYPPATHTDRKPLLDRPPHPQNQTPSEHNHTLTHPPMAQQGALYSSNSRGNANSFRSHSNAHLYQQKAVESRLKRGYWPEENNHITPVPSPLV